jgi:hypothetical protein
MIPLLMKMKVPKKNRGRRTLYIPLFFAWILLFVLFVLILPIWLIASLAAYLMGYGWIGFIIVPLIVNTLWHLKGLEVDIQSPRESFCMKFL